MTHVIGGVIGAAKSLLDLIVDNARKRMRRRGRWSINPVRPGREAFA